MLLHIKNYVDCRILHKYLDLKPNETLFVTPTLFQNKFLQLENLFLRIFGFVIFIKKCTQLVYWSCALLRPSIYLIQVLVFFLHSVELVPYYAF